MGPAVINAEGTNGRLVYSTNPIDKQEFVVLAGLAERRS
jgi:hypothetical protein